jgi:hypothetical protein
MILSSLKALAEFTNLGSLQAAFEYHLGRRLEPTITMSDAPSEPVDDDSNDFSVRESREEESSEDPLGPTIDREDHLAGDDRSEVDYEPSEPCDSDDDSGEGSGVRLLR